MEKMNREEVIKWAEDFKNNFKDGVGKVKALTYADKMLTQAIEIIKDYDRLKQENDRLQKRDCNATVELCFKGKNNPFERETLKIVDVGVSDNIYIVKSELVKKLQNELSTLKTLIREIKEKLPEKKEGNTYSDVEIQVAYDNCHDQFTELLKPLFKKVEGEK